MSNKEKDDAIIEVSVGVHFFRPTHLQDFLGRDVFFKSLPLNRLLTKDKNFCLSFTQSSTVFKEFH